VELFLAPIEPSRLAHTRAPKQMILTDAKARYKRSAPQRRRRQSVCQIPGVINTREFDGNSAIFARKCDQSEVKDT
jgi:hypothetical protein